MDFYTCYIDSIYNISGVKDFFYVNDDFIKVISKRIDLSKLNLPLTAPLSEDIMNLELPILEK